MRAPRGWPAPARPGSGTGKGAPAPRLLDRAGTLLRDRAASRARRRQAPANPLHPNHRRGAGGTGDRLRSPLPYRAKKPSPTDRKPFALARPTSGEPAMTTVSGQSQRLLVRSSWPAKRFGVGWRTAAPPEPCDKILPGAGRAAASRGRLSQLPPSRRPKAAVAPSEPTSAHSGRFAFLAS